MMKYPIFSLASTLLAVPFFTLSAQAVPLTPALKARFRDLNEKGFPIYNTSTGGWTLGMAPEAKLVGCLQVLGLDDAGREVKPVGRVEPGTEVDLPQGTVLLLGPTAPRAGVMAAGKSFRAPLYLRDAKGTRIGFTLERRSRGDRACSYRFDPSLGQEDLERTFLIMQKGTGELLGCNVRELTIQAPTAPTH
jgi:hypothetical protein